jgi:hypothetical protein
MGRQRRKIDAVRDRFADSARRNLFIRLFSAIQFIRYTRRARERGTFRFAFVRRAISSRKALTTLSRNRD